MEVSSFSPEDKMKLAQDYVDSMGIPLAAAIERDLILPDHAERIREGFSLIQEQDGGGA